ncbi:MAG: dTMP kinase [Candidatus Comchoanobacterales bacterium]
MTEQNKGLFITLEGIEGAGKSSAISCISNWLTEHNLPFVVTREPGGTELAERIRTCVTEPSNEPICIKAELLLMFAARAQHIEQVIKPSLAAGICVVSDRFVDASYAYQGAGRNIPEVWLDQLTAMVVSQAMPDATFILDVPVKVGMSRIQQRNSLDRIEQEHNDFFEKVRLSYLERARQEPTRIKVIDANQSIDKVHDALVNELRTLVHD